MCGPAHSESGCATALPLPSSPALRSRLSGHRHRVSQAWPRPGHRGRTEARGFSSSRPPPGPRPLPGRQDLQCEGARPFPRPVHLRCPALLTPLSGQEQRGRGATGGPPTHLRARAATPGGQRHPEPPQPLLLPPPEAPLRKRDHWSEAATIPDMVPPSAPPTSPFPHARLPSRSYWGAEVHFPRSDAHKEAAPRLCPRLSVLLEN